MSNIPPKSPSQSHRRRSIRLQGYDYSSPGAYFVTICAQGRESLFGAIAEGSMAPSPAGLMVDSFWRRLPEKFPHISLDESIVMPNHFHGILLFNGAPSHTEPTVGADPRVRPGSKSQPRQLIDADLSGHAGTKTPGGYMGPEEPGGHTGPPLPGIVQWFKTMTTNAYIRAVRENAWPPFARRLWQRNYYERVIRDDRELALARQYIIDNPAKWPIDQENPSNRP